MSSNVKVCDIEDDVKEELKKFRFRKNKNNAALILKVVRERQKICIDELLEDITIDELQDSLPGHQPRYIVYSYKMEHADGRLSYPMCFIYYTPRDSQMELQIMYAGTKLALQKEADLTRVYEVRELDELTEDWLKEKLSR
ncbi:glia maturation factor [Neodiprion pinetum]|uniref:glia maturation factor beta n=1 Tax=Neodiprion fabricii TaxID=2872261 RepID=UPI00076FBB0F|nr:glia maturation factor beta [Neodiprion fabricii]XP_046418025.1 glia maturation factor beta [Neodiprion fabricii]XP_046418026.1 glia maturation factor beta [Neodiprion fabricii]XP_046473786.1 glia maturation factor beta [Neodiprion pinetum]XP_046473787.1 glia maturation factor beta [Neodiprion pinetum]XP_046473788.1 glia maturation factor beta [Neodiprion pinetum]XP_046473789.1 glia maturation factor beta [Neodiprion pinetum]XP_046611397.1 glia maturation factor beta [Neodiprion virginian